MSDRVFSTWKGRPLFWGDDAGVLHADAMLYAEARGITVDEAERELTELLHDLLPGVTPTIKHDR